MRLSPEHDTPEQGSEGLDLKIWALRLVRPGPLKYPQKLSFQFFGFKGMLKVPGACLFCKACLNSANEAHSLTDFQV